MLLKHTINVNEIRLAMVVNGTSLLFTFPPFSFYLLKVVCFLLINKISSDPQGNSGNGNSPESCWSIPVPVFFREIPGNFF